MLTFLHVREVSLEFISYLSSNNVLAISSFIFLFLRLVYFLSHASSTRGLHPYNYLILFITLNHYYYILFINLKLTSSHTQATIFFPQFFYLLHTRSRFFSSPFFYFPMHTRFFFFC